MKLKAGDVMVQRGSNAPARVALVLVEVVLLGLSHQVAGAGLREHLLAPSHQRGNIETRD